MICQLHPLHLFLSIWVHSFDQPSPRNHIWLDDLVVAVKHPPVELCVVEFIENSILICAMRGFCDAGEESSNFYHSHKKSKFYLRKENVSPNDMIIRFANGLDMRQNYGKSGPRSVLRDLVPKKRKEDSICIKFSNIQAGLLAGKWLKVSRSSKISTTQSYLGPWNLLHLW